VSSKAKPLTKAKIVLLGPLTVSFVAKVLVNSSRLVHPLDEYFCRWFFNIITFYVHLKKNLLLIGMVVEFFF